MLLDETLDGESAAGNHADKLISAFVFSIFLFLLSGGGVGGLIIRFISTLFSFTVSPNITTEYYSTPVNLSFLLFKKKASSLAWLLVGRAEPPPTPPNYTSPPPKHTDASPIRYRPGCGRRDGGSGVLQGGSCVPRRSASASGIWHKHRRSCTEAQSHYSKQIRAEKRIPRSHVGDAGAVGHQLKHARCQTLNPGSWTVHSEPPLTPAAHIHHNPDPPQSFRRKFDTSPKSNSQLWKPLLFSLPTADWSSRWWRAAKTARRLL